MKKVNHKSDFDFILRLCDGRGEEIGIPAYDWTATFYTMNRTDVFVASGAGGLRTNWYDDGGRIHVVADSHGLPPGRLRVEFVALLPDDRYPDGTQRIVAPMPLDIELVRMAAPCPSSAEAELALPLIKGEPFTYGDFTPEQMAGLRKPALDAAELAARATEDAVARADKAAAEAVAAAEGLSAALASKQDALTVSPDLSISDDNLLSLTDMAKMRLFIDMWNAACGIWGKYNEETGCFELNGLTDITYEEAVNIYVYSHGALNTTRLDEAFDGADMRTNLPFVTLTKSENGLSLRSAFRNSKAEVINLSPMDYPGKPTKITGSTCWIFLSNRLHTVQGQLNFADSSPYFNGLGPNLENINIVNLIRSIDVRTCSKLSLGSFQYMVNNAANASAITITVHPDVYARITDEDNAEWHALIGLAAGKNIQFATT